MAGMGDSLGMARMGNSRVKDAQAWALVLVDHQFQIIFLCDFQQKNTSNSCSGATPKI